jgi:hypothetical protein
MRFEKVRNHGLLPFLDWNCSDGSQPPSMENHMPVLKWGIIFSLLFGKILSNDDENPDTGRTLHKVSPSHLLGLSAAVIAHGRLDMEGEGKPLP